MVLEQADGPLGPKEIFERTCGERGVMGTYDHARSIIPAMADAGLIARLGHGKYTTVERASNMLTLVTSGDDNEVGDDSYGDEDNACNTDNQHSQHNPHNQVIEAFVEFVELVGDEEAADPVARDSAVKQAFVDGDFDYACALKVHQELLKTGRTATRTELARALGIDTSELGYAVDILEEARVVVCGEYVMDVEEEG